MTREEWLDRIAAIRQWTQGGKRAPHKPLLLLYALGRLQRTGKSEVSFIDAEPHLQALLDEFGPPDHKTTPAYPFHHLQTDGLWVVHTDDGSDPGAAIGKLRASGATGELDPSFELALRSDPGLAALVAHRLLDAEYPESLRSEVCAAAGLDVEAFEMTAAQRRATQLVTERRRRNPVFREEVLVAYEYQCAVCGYDGRLGREAVGLDAAHIRWWAFDGPDTIDNALCLCTFHHKLLDRGALGVTSEHTVAVSRHFVGRGSAARHLVLDLVGRALIEPQPGMDSPHDDHVQWHSEQVFRSPARSSSG